jgi:hypothetical protein
MEALPIIFTLTGTSLKGQSKGHAVTCHDWYKAESGGKLHLFIISALDEDGWSIPHASRFASATHPPVLIVEMAGWAPGPI